MDLFGQVNSEMVRGRQISGTGGAVDFMRGARMSAGGRSIVALEATAGGGRFSRIVPELPPAHAATALRTDADLFVTEHGVAEVRGLDLVERARRLIAIAAPQFRQELEERVSNAVPDPGQLTGSALYAFALGRADTAWCQRRRFGVSSVTLNFVTRPKSIPIWAVMSAIEYASPATKLAVGEFLVQPLQTLRRVAALTLAVVRELLDAVGEVRVGVAEDLHDRQRDLELHPPLPHLDAGGLLGVAAAHQRRFRLQLLEVAADGRPTRR